MDDPDDLIEGEAEALAEFAAMIEYRHNHDQPRHH